MTSYTELQLQLPNCKHKDLNLYEGQKIDKE